MTSRDRRPLLVTGVPRSGTTWCARLLATAAGTALAGREPMNPRDGQYALGGTLAGWARLAALSSRQRRVLRATYAGRNLRAYGRYGRHQWRGPLPTSRLVVKDPFAMLSTPAITRVTNARVLQVYRHPAAVWSSYRRMGWRPDLDEIAPFVPEAIRVEPGLSEVWERGLHALGPAAQMGFFWSVLQTLMMIDLKQTSDTLVIAHHELASGGPAAATALFDAIGLRPTAETVEEMRGDARAPSPSATRLHQLDRSPAEVASSWRSGLEADEIEQIEQIAGPTIAAVDRLRFSW
ncbi:MAG: sulfotransferase [Nocardioides sp.]|uniref:sulfotransferase n=1 Tax=Nocardioides sp. TaxID=35761 RepID=UPI0039E45FD2